MQHAVYSCDDDVYPITVQRCRLVCLQRRSASAHAGGAPQGAGGTSGPRLGRSLANSAFVSGHEEPISVGINSGATGYAGGELVRLLLHHPGVRIVGMQGRDRDDQPIEALHRHLGRTVWSSVGRCHRPMPSSPRCHMASPRGTSCRHYRPRVDPSRHWPGLPSPRPGRLPALVRVRTPRSGAALRRGLRPARTPP